MADVYRDARVGNLNATINRIAGHRGIKLPKRDALIARRAEWWRLSRLPDPALPDPVAVKDPEAALDEYSAARIVTEAKRDDAVRELAVMDSHMANINRDSVAAVVDVLVKEFDVALKSFRAAIVKIPAGFDSTSLLGGTVSVDTYAAVNDATGHALTLESLVHDRVELAHGVGETTAALRARSLHHWPIFVTELAAPPSSQRELIARFTPLWITLQQVADSNDVVDRWRTLCALEADGYLTVKMANATETSERIQKLMLWRDRRDGVQSPEERVSMAAERGGVVLFN